MDARWILLLVLIILTRKGDVTAHECTKSESIACKKEIEDLRQNEGRYFYATDNEALSEMCRKQILAVNCVNSFANECLSETEQVYFKTLVLGFDKFFNTFCFEDSVLRKRYLEHSSCIRSISTKLDECTQRYQSAQEELDAMPDDSKTLLQKTCCIYFENIYCSTNATENACGKEAAQLVSNLWTLLSGTYLTKSCDPFSKYDPESCTLISSSIRSVPNLIVWTYIFIFYVTFRILS